MKEDTIIDNVGKLGRYGLIGVMLALISLTSFSVWMLWKITSNHIDHNTAAMGEVSKALFENAKTTSNLQTFLQTRLR